MYNNYVEEPTDYESSSIILEAQGTRGALLLGDFNAATDTQLIDRHCIRTIVTAAAGLEHIPVDPSIAHVTYPLADLKSENISSFFNESYETIEDRRHQYDSGLQRGSVLVHCAAGVSRSATIVIAYLIKKYKWSFREAIQLVKQKRPVVCPNLGFEMQLKYYEKLLLPQARSSRICKTLIPAKKLIEFPDRSEMPSVGKGHNYERFPQISSVSKTSVRRKRDLSQLIALQDRHNGRMSSHVRQPASDLIMSGTPGYNSCLSRNRDSILESQSKPNSIHVSRKVERSRELDVRPDVMMSSSKWLGSGGPNVSISRPSMRLNLRKVDGRVNNIASLKR